VKILTEISGIFGKFFPEISGDFPRGQNQIYGCIFAFCHFFWGENPEISGISEFPKFPKIGENPGEISEDFDEKKDKFTGCIFVFPLVQNPGNFREKFRENFRKISGNFGKFWKFFPRGHFPKSGKFRGKTPPKISILRLCFSISPFFIRGVPEISGKFRKINFDKFREISEIFFRRDTFRKISGKFPRSFHH
jgi:hypothetical protein